jgi:hypothetical protein
MDHVRAMKTVREWEYTLRFGHLGNSQSSRANNSRVVEYFSDSYVDQREAVQKAQFYGHCDTSWPGKKPRRLALTP